jgi:hypothetical protein
MVVEGGALAAAAFAMGAAVAETEELDRYKLLLNWNEIRPRGRLETVHCPLSLIFNYQGGFLSTGAHIEFTSIEQKTASHNPRSTVGTVTDIHDYLRLLFARAGTLCCPEHKLPLQSQTVSQMWTW